MIAVADVLVASVNWRVRLSML